ncbi:divalent cation transporter [Achromobacter sp. HZ01]|jgi:ZIP family zinc transporter|uniref:ZIP family metal transporter n=1 Tax=Achromobacter pulmonis TaxID=1389932 RepID=A0A2N8KHI7_9BURK|nr:MULTISPECIES: ZIP family metal transporter [Achromobacter]MBO9327560.1 ZIP family metal transporter [Achromobacter xylosoxidans]PND32924.1 ZIP family metal transporter [Achromobacter pulmonis]RAP63146.1 divalent cation transporter [Achromobacter sp. HZ01]
MNTFSRHRVRPAATSISVWTLAVLVSCLALHQLWAYLDVRAPHVADALLGGLVAAAATALGTVPILFARSIPQKLQDSMFGFGAGVMLAASAFSLVAPGIAAARGLGYGPWGAGLTVAGAVLLGAAVLLLMDRTLPHEHFIKGREGIEAHRLRRTWLFVFAITLHNLPEGLAIGVGYAGNDPLRGTALATGIAIQDIPEGLVVAVALLAAGYPRAFAAALGMLSGMVEPLGAVLGAAVVGWSAPMLPWGLGFAAGAMLFVISHEIIPESHRKGHEVYATCGLMLGFVLMMLLDTALG